jgi:hypothetical protein
MRLEFRLVCTSSVLRMDFWSTFDLCLRNFLNDCICVMCSNMFVIETHSGWCRLKQIKYFACGCKYWNSSSNTHTHSFYGRHFASSQNKAFAIPRDLIEASKFKFAFSSLNNIFRSPVVKIGRLALLWYVFVTLWSYGELLLLWGSCRFNVGLQRTYFLFMAYLATLSVTQIMQRRMIRMWKEAIVT